MTVEANPIMAEFDTIDRYLNAARGTLRDGHMPDMVALDARIAHLCTSIEKCDSGTQQSCLPRLNSLLQKIDMCEAEVRALHEATVKGAQ